MSAGYQIQLPVFEGPLGLLLQLIEREELDITTVALAQVTDQYLAYLAEMEQRQAKDLTDFIVVAARLLFIKSQALLSRPAEMAPEGEDVGDELVRQLREYKRFKKLAGLLREREKQGLRGYVRVAPLPHVDPHLDMDGVTFLDLVTIVQEALDALPASPAGDVVAPPTVTIGEQIAQIEERLARHSQIRFREVLSEAATRVELIVTLLAVLELIKQDRARVRQEQLFGEIVIERQVPADVAATAPAA